MFSQVFHVSKFASVVSALQEAQQAGSGAVATTTLTTLKNLFYGVEAGLEVDVTWVYLGRASVWERQLPSAVRLQAVPASDDPRVTMPDGIYEGTQHSG